MLEFDSIRVPKYIRGRVLIFLFLKCQTLNYFGTFFDEYLIKSSLESPNYIISSLITYYPRSILTPHLILLIKFNAMMFWHVMAPIYSKVRQTSTNINTRRNNYLSYCTHTTPASAANAYILS